MPLQSKVKQYDLDDMVFALLSERGTEFYGSKPFHWQVEAAQAILCGQDVILDVGTGSGKTLCFSLPLLLHNKDIAITISPLTALMVEQAQSARLKTVAVCEETLGRFGSKKLYEDIAKGEFRQVLVSPEIAVSPEFHKEVLLKETFISHLRMVNVDEVHCINVWGGGFRPDYAALGILRGRFPRNVPFLVASATLPDHVLDDVRSKLRLSKDAKLIQVSNARPNVALSVRVMKHSDNSKGDLRFLIPPNAQHPEDIPITLVYCNQRLTTEDSCDHLRDWAEDSGISPEVIAYYHALVGTERKRDIERLLAEGKICILSCTDAVGMGCDMRNIARVILWGLPPSFCALVQRAGRAGQDLSTLGEAILIVPESVLRKDGTNLEDVERRVGDATIGSESLDRDVDETDLGTIIEALDGEGIRIGLGADDTGSEEEEQQTSVGKRRKKFGKDTNIKETRALLEFASTNSCRRIPWDKFFGNDQKLQLIYLANTMYQPIIGTRCCDNCEPRLFPVEDVVVERPRGLKRGKKKLVTDAEREVIRHDLIVWRTELFKSIYGDLTSLSSKMVFDDEMIEKLGTCGERIESYDELRRHVQWALGHDNMTGGPNEYGQQLLNALKKINGKLDRVHEQQEQQKYEDNTKKPFDVLTAVSYGGEEQHIVPYEDERRIYVQNLQHEFEIVTPENYKYI